MFPNGNGLGNIQVVPSVGSNYGLPTPVLGVGETPVIPAQVPDGESRSPVENPPTAATRPVPVQNPATASQPTPIAVSQDTVTFKFDCSTGVSGTAGNLVSATGLEFRTQHGCVFSSTTLAASILASKTLAMAEIESRCPDVRADGVHYFQISNTDPQRVSSYGGQGWAQGPILGEFAFRTQSLNYEIYPGRILADLNPNNLYSGQTMTIDPSKCDQKYSPLLVQMTDSLEAKPIALGSQLRGILFNILGAFADPFPHSPKQISWFTNDDYALLALPNSAGCVMGIDELFGDMTTGHDGQRASNGYAALAKFDDNADGYIAKEDAIFSKLRLWTDRNRDGVSQPSELVSLGSAGLTVIDPHFDAKFKEVDQYGNETLLKSVVKFSSGKLHLMFDLWFALKR